MMDDDFGRHRSLEHGVLQAWPRLLRLFRILGVFGMGMVGHKYSGFDVG